MNQKPEIENGAVPDAERNLAYYLKEITSHLESIALSLKSIDEKGVNTFEQNDIKIFEQNL
jgi:hypothetical protein